MDMTIKIYGKNKPETKKKLSPLSTTDKKIAPEHSIHAQ